LRGLSQRGLRKQKGDHHDPLLDKQWPVPGNETQNDKDGNRTNTDREPVRKKADARRQQYIKEKVKRSPIPAR